MGYRWHAEICANERLLQLIPINVRECLNSVVTLDLLPRRLHIQAAGEIYRPIASFEATLSAKFRYMASD
jgi:hypothetical protein